MTFRVHELHQILPGRLAHLWVGDQARNRVITCVTSISCPADLAGAQSGELMIVSSPDNAGELALQVIDRRVPAAPAMLLLPAQHLSETEEDRIRAGAVNGAIAAGVLAPGTTPQNVFNLLSRAVASSFSAGDATRLHAAQTLQSLAETLGRLIENSVTIESPAHEVLANSPTGHDVDPARVNTILRRRADAGILEHANLKQFVAQVRVSDRPVRLDPQPELGHAGRVAMRVASDGEVYGIIWVTDTARPLTDDDYDTIRQAAEVAAAIFGRDSLTERREAMLRAELLEDVIKGRIADPENVRTVALSVGWNIDRLQQALVVAIDDFEAFRLRRAGRTGSGWRREQDRLTELVKLEVLAIDPAAVVGQRSSSLVILLDAGRDTAAERKVAALRLAESIVRRAAAFLPETRVTVGVGREFPSLERLGESFRQAELAAELGQSLWGGNRALHYDDLGIHRVLFALREHEGMVPPALQRIIEHDREHGTDYLQTLAAYLRHMGRLRTAAEELGIHRNTLEYRVGRIAQLAEMDLDDADGRLALELGIRLLELGAPPA